MAVPYNYPCDARDSRVNDVITLDASKLAAWADTKVTHASVINEQAFLLDERGKVLPRDAQASTATFAIWLNVATRSNNASDFAKSIRKASAGVGLSMAKGTGEVRFAGSIEDKGAACQRIADALNPTGVGKASATPRKARVAKVEAPIEDVASIVAEAIAEIETMDANS